MEFKIIRKVDNLGRIVIPRDIRRALDLGRGASVEITVENRVVCIRRATP